MFTRHLCFPANIIFFMRNTPFPSYFFHCWRKINHGARPYAYHMIDEKGINRSLHKYLLSLANIYTVCGIAHSPTH